MAYMQVSLVTWQAEVPSRDAQEVARRVREGLATLARSLPGVLAYHTFSAREDEQVLVTVITFDTAQHADSGQARLGGWVHDNAGQVQGAPVVYSGEILASPAEQAAAQARGS